MPKQRRRPAAELTAFDPSVSVRYTAHMNRDLEQQYREALRGLNYAEVARETGRGLRTLHAYMKGYRRITEPAARELIAYLRAKSETFTTAANRVEAALEKEED